MLSFNPFLKAFGIDISDLRLRLVQFDKSRKHLSLRCANEIVVPQGMITNGEILNELAVANLVKKLVEGVSGKRVRSHYVIASLPERKTFFKVIDIPLVPEKEMAGTIRWGIEQNIPVTMDEVAYDWQVISQDQKHATLRAAVAVIPKTIPESYVSMLEKAGLTPVVLETESGAIARALMPVHDELATIFVDIWASRTSLILYDEGGIHYSSTIEISGQEMTNSIARKLSLTPEQAEKAKQICGLDQRKGRGAVRTVVLPLLEPIFYKIDEIINFYKNSLNKKQEISIVLSGGVSQMIGMEQYFKEKISLPVSIGNPAEITPSLAKQTLIPQTHIRSFTTAVGLALRPHLSPDSMMV